jgi:hypothetical protein
MPASRLAQRRRRCEPVCMTVDQLNKRLRWLVLERLELDDRGAAADVLERNQRETVRLQHKLAYVSVGSETPDRVA